MHNTGKTEHACAIDIQQIGILIKGASGSGKTSLMLGLLEHATRKDLNCALIADDQVFLKSFSNTIEAFVPKKIQGLVEIRGYGIVNYPNKPSVQISLVVELIEDEKIERMPDPKTILVKATKLAYLQVPMRHENQAIRIIFAWLKDNTDLQLT